MDIAKALRNESIDEGSQARGVNPVAVGDENNRLGRAIIGGGGGGGGGRRRGRLGGIIGSDVGLVAIADLPAEKDFLEIGDQARRQQAVLHGSRSHGKRWRWRNGGIWDKKSKSKKTLEMQRGKRDERMRSEKEGIGNGILG